VGCGVLVGERREENGKAERRGKAEAASAQQQTLSRQQRRPPDRDA